MAYATVSWQPDDEVTSQKLQQMCDNITFLNDNNTKGELQKQDQTGQVFYDGAATKVLGIYRAYDSGAVQPFMLVRVNLPPIFTSVVIPTVTLVVDEPLAPLIHSVTLSYVEIVIFNPDGVQRRMTGGLYMNIIGV